MCVPGPQTMKEIPWKELAELVLAKDTASIQESQGQGSAAAALLEVLELG